ncbi:2OG-Fe(II) oxygenase [Sulfitobacter sp. M368]|uniref:2OG-Fe(II) oxygenase n=1 Tax=Sulfitobacter sp. M368 TaxID=2867021 RepID=UPI0021A87C62|nr:2OG-Fe(II) oxygenase [Sulfitobacter sp. M368]UWR14633.1 2OG-Fe(II) oxygenase [Sulfitobacter sp. M368]
MPALYSKPEAFSPGECDRIIAAITAVPSKDAMLVGQNEDHVLRTAQLVWVDDVDGLGWVMERLIEIVRKSNVDQFDFDLREFAESPQVASYRATDSGHFAWHSDIGDGPVARKRKLTLVLQLSLPSSYEGGELEIMPSAQILSASRSQGCVSIFPSFTLHQVVPVRCGVRHSLTVWAHGPAFR